MQAIQRLRRRSSGDVAAPVAPTTPDAAQGRRPSLKAPPPPRPTITTTETHNSDDKGEATVPSFNADTGDGGNSLVPAAISMDQDGGVDPEEFSTALNNPLFSGDGAEGLVSERSMHMFVLPCVCVV